MVCRILMFMWSSKHVPDLTDTEPRLLGFARCHERCLRVVVAQVTWVVVDAVRIEDMLPNGSKYLYSTCIGPKVGT